MLETVASTLGAKSAEAEVAFRFGLGPAQWRYVVFRAERASFSYIDYAAYSASESDDLPVLSGTLEFDLSRSLPALPSNLRNRLVIPMYKWPVFCNFCEMINRG
jgi:hypothetical protein